MILEEKDLAILRGPNVRACLAMLAFKGVCAHLRREGPNPGDPLSRGRRAVKLAAMAGFDLPNPEAEGYRGSGAFARYEAFAVDLAMAAYANGFDILTGWVDWPACAPMPPRLEPVEIFALAGFCTIEEAKDAARRAGLDEAARAEWDRPLTIGEMLAANVDPVDALTKGVKPN